MGLVRAAAGASIGTYVLDRKLGEGGMAEVYLASRSGPHGFTKRVAIKRILPELASDTQLIQMFCDEARVAATLNHPNIAQVLEFGEHEGELFIVMEYVDGVSCSTLLRTASQKGEAIPAGAALYVAREVLLALAFAHEATDESGRSLGIVHRDVSPSNVLVGRIGNVKLIDFGITRSLLAERRTVPGELKGKLRYMSPEQILGAEVDHRSDLFAVGIVLTEMLAGRALFSGRSDLEILSRISRGELGLVRDGGIEKDLAEVLEHALAHRPPNRFQTAREFASAIDDLAQKRELRLDDRAILPYLHALGVLPSSSGTRPVVSEPKAAKVETPPASRREAPASRREPPLRRKPPPLPSSPTSAPPVTLRASPSAVARGNAPPPLPTSRPGARRPSLPRLPAPPPRPSRAASATASSNVPAPESTLVPGGSPSSSNVFISADGSSSSAAPASSEQSFFGGAGIDVAPPSSAPESIGAVGSLGTAAAEDAPPPSSLPLATSGGGALAGEGALSTAAPPPSSMERPPSTSRTGQRVSAYRVRTRSGGVVGPLPRAEMLALLATGRLSAKSHVSIKADAYVQVGNVPALSTLAAHPAYRFREDDAASPEWLERIDAVCIPVALFRIAREKRTGLFVAVDGRRRKRVFFDGGDPVFVSSTDRDELLGRRLVAAGLANEKAIDVALGSHPLKLGEGLVSLGVLGAAQLVRELSRQLEDRLFELGAWRSGEVRFFPGVTLEQEHHVRTREPTAKALTELVREQYAPGDIAAILRPITKELLLPAPDRDARWAELAQSASDVSVQALADGESTVRDIVTRATQNGVPMADALRAVLIGLCAGCITADGWRTKVPATP
ncbi:MAG TPA: protein kinase [Polyangiaceae bacterium]|jgi:serine/threonine-protein kinase|nr:protein kinase [Polyangiaceae bacterium]